MVKAFLAVVVVAFAQQAAAGVQCEGVDDTATLQAAIDALPAGGGRVRVGAGTCGR